MATNMRHDPLNEAEHLGPERLLVKLLKLASMVTRPMQEALGEPRGLSTNELRVIMCLGGEGPCAGHEITRLMGIAPMNVSRAFASLGERGWIEPADDAGNRRRKPMQLNAAGRARFGELYRDLERVAAYLVGSIGGADATTLARLVDGIVGRLEAWPATEE